jgi:hypothetical protein
VLYVPYYCRVIHDDVCCDVNNDVGEGFDDVIPCNTYLAILLLTSSEQSLDLAQLVEHTTVTVPAHIVWSLVRFRQSRRQNFSQAKCF